MSTNLSDDEVGRLCRHYKSLGGKDAAADTIVGLIRKLVTEIAMAVPYGSWNDRLSHPLRTFWILNRNGRMAGSIAYAPQTEAFSTSFTQGAASISWNIPKKLRRAAVTFSPA